MCYFHFSPETPPVPNYLFLLLRFHVYHLSKTARLKFGFLGYLHYCELTPKKGYRLPEMCGRCGDVFIWFLFIGWIINPRVYQLVLSVWQSVESKSVCHSNSQGTLLCFSLRSTCIRPMCWIQTHFSNDFSLVFILFVFLQRGHTSKNQISKTWFGNLSSDLFKWNITFTERHDPEDLESF